MSGLSATAYVSDSRHCWESEHILFSCRKTCVPRKGENLCTRAKVYDCVILWSVYVNMDVGQVGNS